MIKWLRRVRQARTEQKADPLSISELQKQSEGEYLTKRLKDNIARVRNLFGDASDLVVREFTVGNAPSVRAAIIQLSGLVDNKLTASDLLAPLMGESRTAKPKLRSTSPLETIISHAMTLTEVTKVQQLSVIGKNLPVGDTLLLIEGESFGLLCKTAGFEHRSVEEPASETGVRVPREGFTEVLDVNTSLLRRRIRDPRLRLESIQIGAVTNTEIIIAYVEGIVDDGIVEEVRSRLRRIRTDAILESAYIESYIHDSPYSIFPQIRTTERPDIVAGNLLGGQVAIMTAGTPIALLVPTTLPEMLHAGEDSYSHYGMVSFLRLIRYIAYIFSMIAPGVYVALISYHHEMLPATLFHDIAAAREGVPFPAFAEALFMLLVFEILREASIRLPRVVGSSMTIVGALVLGQQTVSAGLASSSMVVVVSATAIASFTNPTYTLDTSSRLLRFVYVIAAAAIGLYGVFFIGCIVLMHLCALRSFGIPYLSPLAPVHSKDIPDTIIRRPLWMMITRPHYLSVKELQRQDRDNKPEP